MKSSSSIAALQEYLRDESRRTGTSEQIFFPETKQDIIRVFKERPGIPVTVQGARTGVTAGCVPEEGITVNLERMNRILDFQPKSGTITVQPGLRLRELRRYIASHGLFFPPDPTETTASLGGMVSCNSSGARSFRYGSIRDYVMALELILPDGDALRLERGKCQAEGLSFCLTTRGGRIISGTLPDLKMPDVKKHTAGYYVRPGMDLIDLFIGAEGTLGVITSIQLRLLTQKKHIWGAVIFLPSEDSALELVKILRGEKDATPSLSPEALEFFGCDTLKLLRKEQISGASLADTQLIREDAGCAVYIEYASDDKNHLTQVFGQVCNRIEALGSDPYHTWAGINPRHMEKLHLFRHAAPECINRKIAEIKKQYPSITKLGTDMSVPDSCLDEVFSLYRCGLKREGLSSAVFGHIGNNHLHVNVIPKNMDEFRRTKDLFSRWAKEIVRMGGSVSAEHGIGKLKTDLLKKLYSEEQVAAMREVKKRFDPDEILNRGNIFK